MYHIYLDESDRNGTHYSNFYGGLIIDTKYLNEFIGKIGAALISHNIDKEEVKWSKTNAHNFEGYKAAIEVLFDFLMEGKARIRIVFRHNKYRPIGLTKEQRINSYTLLYYQFIKNAFGFQFAPQGDNRIRLLFDEMPINQKQRDDFKNHLVHLFEGKDFTDKCFSLKKEDVSEVRSETHLPLQMLDVVLGAICFRLNDKHKQKNAETNKRGHRTIIKEKLYKHILEQIRKATGRSNFNIGMSTSIEKLTDKWSSPYMHWSFVPNNHEIDESATKHRQ